MGDEERLAVATIAAILADVLSENHHQFVGGSMKATARVRQLDEALQVLKPRHPAMRPGASPYDAGRKRPAATPKGGA